MARGQGKVGAELSPLCPALDATWRFQLKLHPKKVYLFEYWYVQKEGQASKLQLLGRRRSGRPDCLLQLESHAQRGSV